MLASLRSAAVYGVDAHPVHVEVDVSFGLPMFTMVGLPDAAVRESRDRVRSAIRNSGFEFPPHRITVNLAPASLRKAGSAYDLPIALGLLASSGLLTRRDIDDTIVLGELSLDGVVNPVRGVLPIAIEARRAGVTTLLLSPHNAREASVVAGLKILPVRTLTEAAAAINHPEQAVQAEPPPPSHTDTGHAYNDMAEVRGQLLPRRALEIAAAGGHNLLFIGPPGSGKTMLARRLPGILPPLTFDEALDTTAIHSIAGTLGDGGLLDARPFRAPHHTISHIALVGGGTVPRPGEISLAHHGVLFLDEVPEFHRKTLEGLRQPLEEGQITVSRAAGTVVFPGRFVLVGAMNPCPCGYLGAERRVCRCTPNQIAQYSGRLSGPLRDRIDLIVDVPAITAGEITDTTPGESTALVRTRVRSARTRQQQRYQDLPGQTNATLRAAEVSRYCQPDAEGRRLLRRAIDTLGLSARAYGRLQKVARTIADLAGSPNVRADHVAEALQYRAVR